MRNGTLSLGSDIKNQLREHLYLMLLEEKKKGSNYSQYLIVMLK